MSTLYLCAAGNPDGVRLALEVNETTQRWERVVLLDDDPAKQGQEILGVPVIGPFDVLAEHIVGDEAVNLVARSTKGRDGARAKIESFGISLASLIHPTVNLHGSTIGQAVTIYEGCTISALSTAGDHSVVFTQAVLGHGASLGVGAVLAPGAVVNARVKVGKRAYIGANATVLPDLSVGEDATVSACSAAVGDVPTGCVALGVPAEIMGRPEPVVPYNDALGAGIAKSQAADVSESLNEIRAIFALALGAQSTASDSNFFDAGGNSKQAMELQILLKQKLGIPVTIVDIFRFPTPSLLTSHLFGVASTPSLPTRAELRRRRRLSQSSED